MATHGEGGGMDVTSMESFRILLEKLFSNEDVEQLGQILKQHEVMSKAQSKKLLKSLKKESLGDSCQKIVNALIRKDVNIDDIVDDKNFPGDSTTSDLLRYVVKTSDKDLNAMIQNWNFLERYKAVIESMLGVTNIEERETGKNETQRVKNLLNTAMLKLRHGHIEEKQAVQSIVGLIEDEKREVRNSQSREHHSTTNLGQGNVCSAQTTKGSHKESTEVADAKKAKLDQASGDQNDIGRKVSRYQETTDDSRATSQCLNREKEAKYDSSTEHKYFTRSQAVRENRHGATDASLSGRSLESDVGIYPAPPDFLEYLDDEMCVLEFRAVVDESFSLPTNVPLCFNAEVFGWHSQPLAMQFNHKKGYHFCHLICNKNCGFSLKYKFSFYSNNVERQTIENNWEKLPDDNHGTIINRVLQLYCVKTSPVIILDVCFFEHRNSQWWTFQCCRSMERFLPSLENICLGSSQESKFKTTPEIEIFSWINRIKDGWTTVPDGHYYAKENKPSCWEYEKVLIKWLNNLLEAASNNSEDIKSLIITALALTLAFAFEKIEVQSAELLIFVFKMMRTDKLSVDACENLCAVASGKFCHFKEIGLKVPTIPEALQWLYKQIPQKINLDWIFSLPLYYLILHGKVEKKINPQKGKKDLPYSRACLPSILNFDWVKVRQGYMTASQHRNQFLAQAETILKISQHHPWIINTYQFMLSNREVVAMMLKKEEHMIVTLFPIECVLSQYLELFTKRQMKLSLKDGETCDKFISEQINDRVKHASESNIIPEEKDCQITVCIKLLESCVGYLGRFKDLKMMNNKDVLWCLDTVVLKTTEWVNQLRLNEKTMEYFVTVFYKFLELVRKGIANKRVTKTEIEYWGSLLSVKWDLGLITKIWKEQILQEIQKSVNNHHLDPRTKKLNCEKYLNFYASELEGVSLQTDVEICFNEKTSKCAEELLKTCKKGHGFFKKITGIFGISFGRGSNEPKHGFISIFENLFQKEYESCKLDFPSDVTAALHFLCEWSFSVDFYQLFDKEKRKNFSSKVRDLTENVSTNFVKIVKSLGKKDITVEHLEIILENKEKFFAVCDVLVPNKKKSDSSSVDEPDNPLREPVETCKKYLSTFKQTKKAVDDFILVCNLVDFKNSSPPHRQLKARVNTDIQQNNILELVIIGTGGKTSSCNFFGVTEEDLDQFQKISFLKESNVFRKMFLTAVTRQHASHQKAMSCTDLLDQWQCVKERVFTLVEQISKGSITLNAMTGHFGQFEEDKSKIKTEIEKLFEFYGKFHSEDGSATDALSLENCDIRIGQIFNAFEIQQANSAVVVLLELKEMLKLNGDFGGILTRKEMMENQGDVTLSDVPRQLEIDTTGLLDSEKLKTLQVFLCAKEVVKWLQEKMKDMNEVKVMCDLAMISAGEDAIEMDRVSNLLSAVMGFASLIFWTEDERGEAGSKELLERCGKVWENEKATKNLLKKWNGTKQQLHWFKEVEKFYGSVEKSSLTRAQEINNRGIYKIAKSTDDKQSTLENCIDLTIPAETAAVNAQKLTIEGLHELQSKLMLIAGEAEKGRQAVDTFADVLTSVQKLAETYVRLVTSGCVLFTNWEAVVSCNGSTDTITGNLNFEVKFTDEAPPITGCGSHRELDKLTEILKKSHKKWIDYMSSKRMKFYYLNEYNIQQVVYLCRELSKLDGSIDIPDQVHTLLSFVRNNFTTEELKTCLQDARLKTQLDREKCLKIEDSSSESCDISATSTECSNNVEKSPDKTPEGDSDRANTKEMVKAVRTLITEDGFEENVAKAAVQAEGCEDLDSCRSWVLLNEFEDEMVEQFSMDFNNNYDVGQGDIEVEVMHSIFDFAESENTLQSVIRRLHEKVQLTGDDKFLDMANTVCEGFLNETIRMELQDHLSVHMLGQFLDNLSQENRIVRTLVPGMHQGRPNVLVCNEDEILPTVLSLYVYNGDQPLPSRSEVLVCSEQTTAEEVERFLRLAMCESGKGGRLLHCLAFADTLTYATSSVVEDVFDMLSKSRNINEKYQLVFLLSKQQHYLGSCFEKYLVDGKWTQSNEKIQSYLKKHLQVTNSESSAASATAGNYMVKVITSTRSGVGKSLYVQRLKDKLESMREVKSSNVTVRLLENKLDVDYVIHKLDPNPEEINKQNAVLVHIDITPAVQHGIEAFAFNLFVVGCIQGSDGIVWKSHPNHLYAVEVTDFGITGERRFSNHHILNLLPCVKCYAPCDILTAVQFTGEWLEMDEEEFISETFQRPFQYLLKYESTIDLDSFTYKKPEGTPKQCIEVLLRHCCIKNPSWAQLRHFCSFLNVQLKNCEKSVFCSSADVRQDLAGLKLFAVKFMIRMAQDFATPSLEVSDKSVKDTSSYQEEDQQALLAYQIRRKWEETSHPYVFFNEDGQTMTFINVRINRGGYLLDHNGSPAEKMTSPGLVAALLRQGIDLSKKFDDYPRLKKLQHLCLVMGIENAFDPDPTYELTTDNVLKILAIYMRFRCQIPVIIMGETGCGKTRLMEFMSRLKAGENVRENVENMITLKIHGGITAENIQKSVEEAKVIAAQNRESGDFTVLFYDEANTTEAIYAIKEVMCDKSIDGNSFSNLKLQIIAACNPYKKLSDEAIKKLEDSGLGYRNNDTAHLFGNIPVRSLVYRVVSLPPSLQPFVWDFGQLNDDAEKIYIHQMTIKLGRKLNLSQRATAMINNVLSTCQRYMRSRTDECRYVSLRDVERCMMTYDWFHNHCDTIFPEIEREIKSRNESSEFPKIEPEVRSLIQTIGICYHASLDDRKQFRTQLADCLEICDVDEEYIELELMSCQAAFVRNIHIGENIARNEALQENVFMMAICADMKIPLFLIGKPGSSKSLAKTIITSNMQGQRSPNPLYQSLKQIHVLSYQCSALTDAEGIERVFKQCMQLQKEQNPDTFTAVVVLDEIGLAEDSSNMPLKVLHPLLEGRSTDLAIAQRLEKERVGFIGISNWALDPAKMNRGIFLTRNKPSENDLKATGKEISKASLWRNNEDLFETLTSTYLEVYKKQTVEYFGLRDYYSLMKMICSRCQNSEEKIKFADAVYAVLRNFSGGENSIVQLFLENVKKALPNETHKKIPLIPIQTMIRDNLQETDSRFLLLLANQFSVVNLIESFIDNSTQKVQVVFGSSFPGDHSYTEICRNINKIKVCMETGKTVILLNMTNIHESLYDALNQHFVTLSGQNYVDLGLGGHRVKCRIANEFRLIVIEKTEIVYQKYPIPLINRLEKHHFNSDNLLLEQQRLESAELQAWVTDFANIDSTFSGRHAFVGFHNDTVSSVILTSEGDLEDYKKVMLQSCPVDAILRLPGSNLHEDEIKNLQNVYFNEQHHDGLSDVLKREIAEVDHISVLEVISFSSLLAKKDVIQLARDLEISETNIILISLEQFQTQQEYLNRLDRFFEKCNLQKSSDTPVVLLVQCAQAQSPSHSTLLACARHCLMNRIREFKVQVRNSESGVNVTVALLLSTEREGEIYSKLETIALQPTHDIKLIVHIDEMRPADGFLAPASKFFGKSLHEVFETTMQSVSHGGDPLVCIKSLLTDCICESVAKVKGQDDGRERFLKRVEILINLCEDEEEISTHFCKILLEKIIKLYSSEEECMDWIVGKANDRESLQEAGTFRKALWLCLKQHVSHFLAYLVSVIDQSDNLDFLEKNPRTYWQQEMWLGMFSLIEVTWKDLRNSQEFSISSSKNREPCKLPFSFLIIEYLEAQWNAVSSLKAQPTKIYSEIFCHSKMKKVVADALDTAKVYVMKSFITDLVASTFDTSASKDIETSLVEATLFDLSMKMFTRAREDREFERGDEIAIIFTIFKMTFKKLEAFSEILRGCPQILNNLASWGEIQKNTDTFILHVLAFKAVLGILKEKAQNIQDPATCLEWINLSRIGKLFYDSISRTAIDTDDWPEISKAWVPLCLLDLLLLHLVPVQCSNYYSSEQFMKAIAPHAKLFWKVSTTDVRSSKFLHNVLSVLKRCYDDVHLQLLLDWQDSRCKLCNKKVRIPTFLPCSHFGCENCVKRHMQSGKKCTVCNEMISEEFIPVPACLDDNRKKILEDLKSNGTSILLECLQRFCFKNSDGFMKRMETETKQIIKELIIESSDSDRKLLDPAGLDLNINTKSSMLRILSRYDCRFVTEEINRWLGKLDADDKNSFITVVLITLEQRVMAKSIKFKQDDTKMFKFWKERMSTAWENLLANEEPVLNMDCLLNVAEIRCGFTLFASLTNDVFSGVDSLGSAKESFTHFCREILTKDEMPLVAKEYVIIVGCHKFGIEWLFQLAQHDDLRAIIPPHLRQAAECHSVDHWALLGKEYIRTKSELYLTQSDDYEEVLAPILDYGGINILSHLLAIAAWCDKKSTDLQDVVTDILKQKCGNFSEVLKFLTKKKSSVKSALKKYSTSSQQTESLYQLMILVIAATAMQNDIMNGFSGILKNPTTASNLYLPTMSEDVYFATPADFRVEVETENSMYTCPNGHLYSIGDCTRPYVIANCLECGAIIGGKLHKPAPGNQRILKNVQSQAGYKFNRPGNVLTGDERMSPQGAAVTRFFLHSCLLASSTDHPEVISSMLECEEIDEAQRFLVHELLNNLKNLSKALARNLDDAILILHKILLRILQKGPTTHSERWATLDARKDWEQKFRSDYLLPIFQNLEIELANARTVMREVEETGSVPLHRVLQEIREDENIVGSATAAWKTLPLWTIIEHQNSARLLQILQDRTDTENGKVLQIILQTPELYFIRHLENVLKLQIRLTEIYRYQIDMKDADTKTLRNHIDDNGQPDVDDIDEYIVIWNETFERLRNCTPESVQLYFQPINLDSPLSMVLPSARGRGQCAKMMAEYLIDIQNQFLSKCKHEMMSNHPIKEVEVYQLTSVDFVCINKEKDLLDLINMNTQYTINVDQQGRRHAINYNIEALEKQVREKFVLCKKLIEKNTLPLMRYPQDVGIGSDWAEVASRTQQEPLTAKLSEHIDKVVAGAHSSVVCEGVRTLTNAISFLAMVNADSSKSLCEFLANDLHLPPTRISMIPLSAQTCHVLSLYQRISWHKAIIFVQQGLDPYKEALSGMEQENIHGNIFEETQEALKQTDVTMLQQRLNELLITGTAVGNPSWRLKDDVFPNVQFIDGNEDASWYSRLPEELQIKHISHLFFLSLDMKNLDH